MHVYMYMYVTMQVHESDFSTRIVHVWHSKRITIGICGTSYGRAANAVDGRPLSSPRGISVDKHFSCCSPAWSYSNTAAGRASKNISSD